MSVVDHQHVHTIRLEATSLERRVHKALGLGDAAADAHLAALLAIARRLELVENVLREREA